MTKKAVSRSYRHSAVGEWVSFFPVIHIIKINMQSLLLKIFRLPNLDNLSKNITRFVIKLFFKQASKILFSITVYP